jgi:hypothetical protein
MAVFEGSVLVKERPETHLLSTFSGYNKTSEPCERAVDVITPDSV